MVYLYRGSYSRFVSLFHRRELKNIILYENKAKEATYKKLADDQYEITITVESKKIFYDGLGEILNESTDKHFIDIGVLGEDTENELGMTQKNPLYLQKHWLGPGEHRLTFIVNELPNKAGIDPYTKLIDRVPEDNLINVIKE